VNSDRITSLTDQIKTAVDNELERRRVTTDGEPGLTTVTLVVRLDEKHNRPRAVLYRIETRADCKSAS
jgi:hypothetical protein